jgi:hypothetical protein
MFDCSNSTNVPAGVLLEYFDRAEHKQREVEVRIEFVYLL